MKRTVVKLDAKKRASRLSRWNSISEAAAKQSGRGICPEVGPILSFEEALREAAAMDLLLVPYENERGMSATEEALALLTPGQSAAIFIGPEGGFDREEIQAAKALGARTISLGRRILRTETAGLAALTLCMYRLETGGTEAIPEEERKKQNGDIL